MAAAKSIFNIVRAIGPMQFALGLGLNWSKVLTGPTIGGNCTVKKGRAWREDLARRYFEVFQPRLGSLTGKVGLEIGPGDTLDHCACHVSMGAARMYAVEPISVPHPRKSVTVIRDRVENAKLPVVDYAFSTDTLEHVDDIRATMRQLFNALKPGGVCINTVDLKGHNLFCSRGNELLHLTCPDWLYWLLTCNLAASNRVRVNELVESARAAGFNVLWSSLETVPETYVRSMRPLLLPRYRDLPEEELMAAQILLVLQRPASATAETARAS